MSEPKYKISSELDRTFDVFGTLGKDAKDLQFISDYNVEAANQSAISMSSLGKFGRFGNQLFQYAFLRICAQKSGAVVECPPWIGQTLFGHNDAPVIHRLPPAIERQAVGNNVFDITPEFIPYIEKLSGGKSCRICPEETLQQEITNVDLWGFFQIQTGWLAPYKSYFRSLFQPVGDLKLSLDEGWNFLRSQGKTFVGVHLRRTDYMTHPRLGFTLAFPASWYCEWLSRIWDELEDPILLVCSDDLNSILPEFEKFSPLTSRDLNVKLPTRMQNSNVEFYIDFFMLSQCDIVITSNSIFSFAACLLNERGRMFVRPCWDFEKKFILFDPWDSEPLLIKEEQKTKFFKSVSEVISITYATQGLLSTIKCLFLYLPKSYLKEWAIRVYLGYQIRGIVGAIKSILSIVLVRSDIW